MSVVIYTDGLEDRVQNSVPAPHNGDCGGGDASPILRWFGRVPQPLLSAAREGRLNGGAIRIATALVLSSAVHPDSDGWCAWEGLNERAGVSEDTARRAVDLLDSLNLVEIERSRSGRYLCRVRLDLASGWSPVPLIDPEHSIADHRVIQLLWALASGQETNTSTRSPLRVWETEIDLDAGTISEIAGAMGVSTKTVQRGIRTAHTSGYLTSVNDPLGGASIRRIRWELGATTIGHRVRAQEMHHRSRATAADVFKKLCATSPKPRPRRAATSKRRANLSPPTVLSRDRSKNPPNPPETASVVGSEILGEVIEASERWRPHHQGLRSVTPARQRAAKLCDDALDNGWSSKQLAKALDRDAAERPLPESIQAPGGLLAHRLAQVIDGAPPDFQPAVVPSQSYFTAGPGPTEEEVRKQKQINSAGLADARRKGLTSIREAK